MIKHPDSHVDHGLSEAQLRYLLDRFADRDSFFIETIELPADLGTAPSGLYGPLAGDLPVGEDRVTYARRGTRRWDSRLVDLPVRQQRKVSLVAGPHEETCTTCEGKLVALGVADGSLGCDHCGGKGKLSYSCILYTAYGGPVAPQEPGDPGCKDPAASAAFWREHALAR